MKIEDLDKKGVVYQHFLKDKRIEIVSCEESVINRIQRVTGDVYDLVYLGIGSKYGFYLALKGDTVLGYSIVQKYFENCFRSIDKGRMRGEPALVYSLKRRHGIGSLLFFVSSLEILKDDKIEVFRCESVKGNVFDKLCPKLGLGFVERKDIFNVYELELKNDNRKSLEEKIKDCLKSL